jgi:hypothetical protein
MAGSVDWGQVGTLGSLMLGILLALIRLTVVVARMQQDIQRHNETIDTNARHLDSTINTAWMLAMRVATAEEFLEREHHYHPPVIVSRGPEPGR